MRRVALVALVFLAFAPVARAGCGAAVSAPSGAAPHVVTLTATCDAASYTLTTDAGVEAVSPVTSIALKLRGPATARYAQWIVLHATVVPRLPVTLRGKRFVGARLRIVASLHPASAGRVVAPAALDTSRPQIVRATVTTRPAAGWARVSQTVEATVVTPSIALGDRGASVRAVESRLAELHYAIKRDGYFGSEDLEAVYAFQKVNALARTGRVDAALWRRPLGVWHVYRKVGGFDWVIYYPSYFLRGFAVHGYPDVPPYPASHGCARIPMWIAQTVYGQMADGSTVIVYT